MEQLKYTVYNQTCESFLSLGVTVADSLSLRVKETIRRRTVTSDGGYWIGNHHRIHIFSAFSSYDLIYLDEKHRVIHVIESFSAFRIAPMRTDAKSVLALPLHTIYLSQTQPGNQLLICAAEEMEFRLWSTSSSGLPDEISSVAPAMQDTHLPKHPLSERLDRRRSIRQPCPRLIAYDWTGAALVVNRIRDISPTGLYLLTEKLWPLGAMVTLTLQRTEEVHENSERSLTIQLKVTRWGADGVGLTFVQPEGPGNSHWWEFLTGRKHWMRLLQLSSQTSTMNI